MSKDRRAPTAQNYQEASEQEISMPSTTQQEHFCGVANHLAQSGPVAKIQRISSVLMSCTSGALYLVHSNTTQECRLHSPVQGLKAHGAREHNFSKSVDRPVYSKSRSSIAGKEHSRTWNTLICVCAMTILFALLNIIELRISAEVTSTHSGVQRSANGTRFAGSSKGA